MENNENCKRSGSRFCTMVKVDRAAAWVLLVVMLMYAVTGYGMTKGVIDRALATELHLGLLGAVGLVAFVIHTGWAIHLAFKRWRMWNVFGKAAMGAFYMVAVLGLLYVQFFYQVKPVGVLLTTDKSGVFNQGWKVCAQDGDCVLVRDPSCCGCDGESINLKYKSDYDIYLDNIILNCDGIQCSSCRPREKADSPICVNNTCSSLYSQKSTAPKAFSLSELAQYNGLSGNPAYAAVDGVVYDLSSVFRRGNHQGHSAGQDLTAVFYSAHSKDILSRYPQVGILK